MTARLWSDRVKARLFVLLALLFASPLAAQVGHDPATSPYKDLEYNQEFTPIFGYTRAREDPAKILPKSAAVAGLRYQITMVGPLAFSAEGTRMFSDRDVINPGRPARFRALGTQSAPVYALDVALALALTGHKSWHGIVPEVRGGAGVVHSPAKDDSTGYTFGTPFAFHFGGGLRFVPGGRMQIRADISERLFKQTYPDAYYTIASDNTAVLTNATQRSNFTHHTQMTVGVSYLFGR